MYHLKEKLLGICDYIEDKNDVIYLDYPTHLNVGDLLIYQGTENFFDENKITIKLRRNYIDCNITEINEIISPQSTILLHGGGNFGDLYPKIQELRESIVRNFPDNRIIILPQTAYFDDKRNLERSAEIFERHSNVIIFSRDIRSLSIFNLFSKQVFLMPDMAHSLYGKLNISDNRHGTLCFLRKDIEINHSQNDFIVDEYPNVEVYDWDDVLTRGDFLFKRLISVVDRFSAKYNINFLKKIISIIWKKYTREGANKYPPQRK